MDFTDHNEYNGAHTIYSVVNESVNVWREGLSQIPPVERAASICSGGEISFFCVLPRIKRSLVLIDHSYQSMYFALGKFHLIDKLGSRKAFSALAKNDVEVLKPLFEEANKGLPTASPKTPKEVLKYDADLKKWSDDYRKWQDEYVAKNPRPVSAPYSYGLKGGYWEWEDEFYRQQGQWQKDHPQPKRPANYRHQRHSFDSLWCGVGNLYEEVTQKGIAEFRAKRDKVSFVHCDLTDLKDLGERVGPFDLIYLSNALDYAGRNGSAAYKPQEWVKPGGYICLTYSTYNDGFDNPPKGIPKGSEKVFEYGRQQRSRYDSYGRLVRAKDPKAKTIPTKYGGMWAYGIFKTPE